MAFTLEQMLGIAPVPGGVTPQPAALGGPDVLSAIPGSVGVGKPLQSVGGTPYGDGESFKKAITMIKMALDPQWAKSALSAMNQVPGARVLPFQGGAPGNMTSQMPLMMPPGAGPAPAQSPQMTEALAELSAASQPEQVLSVEEVPEQPLEPRPGAQAQPAAARSVPRPVMKQAPLPFVGDSLYGDGAAPDTSLYGDPGIGSSAQSFKDKVTSALSGIKGMAPSGPSKTTTSSFIPGRDFSFADQLLSQILSGNTGAMPRLPFA